MPPASRWRSQAGREGDEKKRRMPKVGVRENQSRQLRRRQRRSRSRRGRTRMRMRMKLRMAMRQARRRRRSRKRRRRQGKTACLPADETTTMARKFCKDLRGRGRLAGKVPRSRMAAAGGNKGARAIKLANECQLLLLPRLRLETSSAPNQKTL